MTIDRGGTWEDVDPTHTDIAEEWTGNLEYCPECEGHNTYFSSLGSSGCFDCEAQDYIW